MTANGTAYKSFSSGSYFDQPSLKNAFISCDYYLNLVRYGDFNSVGLEAKASGCQVISYKGNPYADYCISEGDQRVMADELIEIFEGKVEPNKVKDIPTFDDMAQAMKKIYEEIK